jgi:hypothetical protein
MFHEVCRVLSPDLFIIVANTAETREARSLAVIRDVCMPRIRGHAAYV